MSKISEYFRSKINASSIHTRRLDKISDIKRDKDIDNNLRKRIDKSDDPRVKTSLYFKLYRTFEIQSELLPNTRPVSEKWGSVELAAISSLKDTIYMDGMYADLFQMIVNKRMRTDGATFVEIGFSPDGSFIKPKAHQFANVFTDWDADYMAVDERDTGEEYAKWIAFRVRMSKERAKKTFPDKVFQTGDFLPDMTYGAENKNAGGQMQANDPDSVSFYYCYSIEDTPQYCILAGSGATVIDEGEGKENYMRFIKRANGKEYAFLPAVDLHFTRVGAGLCTMSMVGMMADIANSDQRINDIALPALKKVVNKIVAVFGTAGASLDGLEERAREEILMGLERQTLGINPIIALPNGTSMQTISPDAGVINDFIAVDGILMGKANSRFDIDFVKLSNDDVKATVFVGKTKAELQAISAVYKINRGALNRMADYSLALAKFWRLDDKRDVKVQVDDETGYSVSISLDEMLLSIQEWDGNFETDVDLKMPLSTGDKSDAIVQLEAQKQNIFYGKRFSSLDEIIDEIDLLIQRAVMAGLEELYKKPVLIKKAQAILNARNGAAIGNAMPAAAFGGGGMGSSGKTGFDNVNKDVSQELAPQTMLAESGMSVR